MGIEYRIGDAQLHPQQRRLLVDGKDSRIGARAFDLLLALVENRERTVTKNELLDRVWPGLVVEENNLQVHISSLRKLLGRQAIATVPGRGYRFAAALEDAGARASTAAVTTLALGIVAEAGANAPNNLPAELPELYGRAEDLTALRTLITTHKLVTVVGAGGIGKTALAQTLAQQSRDAMDDGVWLVELAPLAHASLVVATVAGVLGIRLATESPVDTLVQALGKSRMLVVLDNCESLLDGIAELAAALYRGAPNVRLLATSQEPLHLPHEQVYRLRPLAVPQIAAALDMARQAGAIALFAARARALQPQFAIDEHNVAAVVDICRQLDGIALAIELAAARVPLLGVEGLRARLGDRFKVLTGGSRLALRRHQTLRAALDWSYGLLSAPEQTVFRQLGIFIGGFSLEAVQALAANAAELDPWVVLEHLGTLVDKSLVVAETGATPRYRLLETTRAYALEQLASAGETQATVERHAQVMRDIFESADEACLGEHGSMHVDEMVDQVWPEFDNLRAALAWAMAEQGQAPLAIALAGAAAVPFRVVGQAPDTLKPMLDLQQHVDDTVDPLRAARFWIGLATGGESRMPLQAVLDAHDRAERIYRRHASTRRLFNTLCTKAFCLGIYRGAGAGDALMPEIIQLEQPQWPGGLRGLRMNVQHMLLSQKGQYEEALAALQEWYRLLPAHGHVLSRLQNINNQCWVLTHLRRFDEAEKLARTAIERHAHDRRLGRWMAGLFGQLLSILTQMGRLDEALVAMHDGTPFWRRDGHLPWQVADAGLLFAKLGRHADAARLAGAEAARLQGLGVSADSSSHQPIDELMQCLHAARIPGEDLDRWMREGSRLTTEDLATMYLDEAAAER